MKIPYIPISDKDHEINMYVETTRGMWTGVASHPVARDWPTTITKATPTPTHDVLNSPSFYLGVKPPSDSFSC